MLEQACRLSHLSVCLGLSVWLSVKWVNCGKTADWIWMPFGVVSGVGRKMGVLDGWRSSKGRGSFGVNVGHPIATNEDLCDMNAKEATWWHVLH